MAFVKCEIAEGLRPEEATVKIESSEGSAVYLRVDRDFLKDQHYLSVGVVEKKKNEVLVELPHESDSGVNRLWVSKDSIKPK